MPPLLSTSRDAEEAMLAGFVTFFSTIGRFVYTDGGGVRAWLQKIVVNEGLMALRKKNALLVLAEADAHTVQQCGENALDALTAKELHQLIAALPDGYRTVFNLYVVEGYSHAEIATMLGVSEATSRSQLLKARQTLQSKINKQSIRP